MITTETVAHHNTYIGCCYAHNAIKRIAMKNPPELTEAELYPLVKLEIEKDLNEKSFLDPKAFDCVLLIVKYYLRLIDEIPEEYQSTRFMRRDGTKPMKGVGSYKVLQDDL
jgi:hypothetical protein